MFKELLQRVVAGEDLNRQQAQEAMRAIMSGEVGETALAAFLTALRMKQETPEEVAATLKKALQFVDADKLLPSTNCGMAPLPREVAKGKLYALSAGTEIVRKELAG